MPKYLLLPHVLGLEVIAASDHLVDDRTGQRKPYYNTRYEAQRLAAGDWWIAGCGPLDWDQRFIDRAQAAIILVSSAHRARVRSPSTACPGTSSTSTRSIYRLRANKIALPAPLPSGRPGNRGAV